MQAIVVLDGMKEICDYLKISESTALRYYRERGLPLRKRGGVWCARKDQVDSWKETSFPHQNYSWREDHKKHRRW